MTLSDLPKGLSEEQAENWMIEYLGHIPDMWNDPITRAEILGQGITPTIIEAHLSNFEQAYGSDTRLGSEAQQVGYKRNIENQGIPDETEWLKQKKQI